MNIIPISGAPFITPIQSAFATEQKDNGNVFKSMFENAVEDLESLNAAKSSDAVDLSLGNIDDISEVQINSQKAEVALQLLVQMRNKILDGYQEIMRINV